MAQDVSCMSTVLRNPRGVSKKYLYLPRQQQFDSLEEKTFFGDIYSLIQNNSDDAETGRRRLKAFLQDIQNQDIEIVKLPAPILEDTATGVVRNLKITSGTLGVEAVCTDDSV